MRRTNVVNRKRALQVVKELDAFPKVPENYVETSASGGGISIITVLIIISLMISEFMYYTSTEMTYSYEVDKAHDGQMKINVDMTVAMKCHLIGADVLDVTGQNAHGFGDLNEEPTFFELEPEQKIFHDMTARINSHVREEYHAIHDVLWRTGYTGQALLMPKRKVNSDLEPDACRLHGSLVVNKVAGNFHITAGKSVPFFGMGGHAHLTMTFNEKDYNFSHRIDSFSFGEFVPGRVNPLDGDMKVSENHYHIYQYFVQVVPTYVSVSGAEMDTYQFAVTERDRPISHQQGSHGVPGIMFKYDLSSFKVNVKEEHKPYWQFIVRLCGIVGGIFATSGLISQVVGSVVDILCCRYKLGKYSPKEADRARQQPIATHTLANNVTADVVPGVNIVPQTSIDNNIVNQQPDT